MLTRLIACLHGVVRDVRTTWLDSVWRDTRHAVRALRAAPGFTVVALAVLTLSIGVSTAIFSVVDAVILRGLPFDEGDRLVAVGELNVKDQSADYRTSLNLVAPQNFLDWRARQDVFTGLAAAVNDVGISLKGDGHGEPETLRAQMVTADFFPVLRVTPLLGRPFTSDNEADGRARVAVISHGLWQRRFGGAPDILARRLPGQLGDFDIVGVMPPTFVYPVGASQPTDVWVPYVVPSDQRVRGNDYGYYLHVIGRLRDGVTIDRAQARMDQITAGLAAETPRWFTDRVARVEALQDFLTRRVRTWMLMLLGAVAFVMLLACVNLANLMLVRASSRARELRLRAALGASRWDLSQGLLIESLVLSVAGASLGVFVAWLGAEVLRSAIPAEVPRAATIAIDLRILASTGVAAIVTGLAFGTAPALQFSRPAAGSVLNQGERTSTAGVAAQWLRASLVVVGHRTDRRNSEPVVILNEAAVRKYFGDEDPLGRVVRLNGVRTIVGVVGNIRHDGPEKDWRTQAFVPIVQSRVAGATLVLRTTSHVSGVLPAVKAAVWSEFPELPIPDIYTLEQYFDRLIAQRHFNMLLLGLFGLLGITIAGIGIYGVMAYVVTERTHEIGIRIALGAVPSTILWSVLGRALRYLTLGLAIGVTGAWSLARLVAGFLFEIQPHDPAVYGGVLTVLMTTGLAAAFWPAQRAARVDPLVGLRMD